MAISTKQRLIERLDRYYKLEGFNAFWIFCFSIYLIFINNFDQVIFLTYGIWFMVYILIQGTHYWRLKLMRLKGIKIDQDYQIKLFKKFKTSNQILCLGIPIVFALQWFVDPNLFSRPKIFYGALFANAFAIAEHINYFHLQLMYDNPFDWQYLKQYKRLKKASLKKDIEEHKI